VDSPGLRPADPQPCAPRRIPVRTAPNREPDRLPTNLAPHGCGAMTRPKPPAVIPGRSRAAAEGKGIQQGDAVAQRRCFVLCKGPLRGDILTLDPLPLRPVGLRPGMTRLALARLTQPFPAPETRCKPKRSARRAGRHTPRLRGGRRSGTQRFAASPRRRPRSGPTSSSGRRRIRVR